MSAALALSSLRGKYRLQELVDKFYRSGGTLEATLAQELIKLARDPRNLVGMTEVEISNIRRTVAVVRSQSGFY
jgi:hypothetical protein